MIRAATVSDRAALWEILEPTIRAGETYTLPRDLSEDESLAYWLAPEHRVSVAMEGGAIVGTYYLRANQRGGGAHVANCGYVVSPRAQGRGVARAMGLRSLTEAREQGFKAMQFNFVVSTNTRAIALWKDLGFVEIGTVPEAFLHPQEGFVDALIMHRRL